MYGICGKVLEVDLSRCSYRVVELPEEVYKRFLGGRGLATWILMKELGNVWENIDPLSGDNILVVASGPLTGFYPGARVCVSGKSPLSNGIVGSTIGSELGMFMKCCGYDAIIVKGASKDPVYLFLFNDKVEIRDASKYWGMRGREFLKAIIEDVYPELRRKLGRAGVPREPSVMYIGPAGENLVRTSAVMAKLTHAAGYGGYGAVMGAKKLKAIIVYSDSPLPKPKDADRVRELALEVIRRRTKFTTLRVWGTGAGGYEVGYISSSEPIRNWQEEWHDNREISVTNFESKLWIKRFWADYGCPTACMKICFSKERNILTDTPDYELQAYLGTNLGIFDPVKIAELASLVDDLGLDGIGTGNVMGFAAELYERGILSRDDVGYDLKFGDVEAFKKLAEDIAYRRGIGNVLAEGTYRAALKIGRQKGVDTLKYAVQVKGIAVGAHGIRSGLDYPQPIAYACSTQGGDHTSVAGTPFESPASEAYAALLDSAVICWFNAYEEIMHEMIRAVTGWREYCRDYAYKKIARSILTLQRIALLLGGPDVTWDPRIHDDNPPRFYEPLPKGPKAGSKVDKKVVEEEKRKYFEQLGWDELGIPKEDTLKELSLEEFTPLLTKIQKRLKQR